MTKILLVEDDRALREIYGVRLLAEGYDIVSASDGEEALTAAINEHPDLIVSDVMMPKISGFEMIDLLRTNEKTRDIKVIVMSALGGDSQKERGRQLGADRYLVKSQVGIEDVVAIVKQVLAEPRSSAAPAGGVPAQPVATPQPEPVAPSVPQANQSAFNPVQATDPSTVAGVAQPALPSTPLAVPTVMNAPAPTQPAPQPTMDPVAASPVPQTQTSPSLPPIPLPSPQQPMQAAPAPAPAPAQIIAQPVDTAPVPPPLPQVAPTLPSAGPAVGGVKVIKPTGTSLSPKIDIDDLLAKEEATEIAPGMNLDPSVPVPSDAPREPDDGSPTITVSQNGVIELDSPAQPDTSGTFPAS